jgi:hypothetical protein
VEIKPNLGADSAQLVDVLVRAVPFGENGKPAEPVCVIVEVKCAWNNGVMVDMERQLFERYLKNTDMHFGIYAVAYFTCNAWNSANDARKKSRNSLIEISDMRRALTDQAKALTNSRKLVQSVVIDARLG